MVHESGFMVHDSGFRDQGSGFGVQGSGIRVPGAVDLRALFYHTIQGLHVSVIKRISMMMMMIPGSGFRVQGFMGTCRIRGARKA